MLDAHSGPGQSLAPVSIGLGGKKTADYIALEWSDGVSQTELDLAAGELHRIAEKQRQLSSCPVIFAWDGESWRFVSDVLGVGGLGFFVSPGEYGEPRPYEKFLLDDGMLVESNGRYLIKLTEPMEENAYLDAAYIQVYDLPEGLVTGHGRTDGYPGETGNRKTHNLPPVSSILSGQQTVPIMTSWRKS